MISESSLVHLDSLTAGLTDDRYDCFLDGYATEPRHENGFRISREQQWVSVTYHAPVCVEVYSSLPTHRIDPLAVAKPHTRNKHSK
jgi:hypothetical protein